MILSKKKQIQSIVFIMVLVLFYSCNSVSELYLIKTNNKWGYINENGDEVIKPIYDNCCFDIYEDSCCSRIIWPDALGVIKLNGKYGTIDCKGVIKTEVKYDYIDIYVNSLIIAKSGNKFGILNSNNDTIFPFIFDNEFIACNYDLGHGRINGKNYLLNFKDATKMETEFDRITYFSEGLAAVKKDGKYGFINKKGELVIDLKFQEVWFFNNSLASAKINYQWGFIDTTGKFVIEPKFDETEGFEIYSNKFAIVKKGSKYGVINKKGEYLIKPKYEYLYLEDKNIFKATIVKENERKTGLIDINEKWILPAQSDAFDYFAGFIKIKKQTGYGLYKLKSNKIVFPFIFEDIVVRPFGLSLATYHDKNSGKCYFSYLNKRGKVIWTENSFNLKRVLKEKNKGIINPVRYPNYLIPD